MKILAIALLVACAPAVTAPLTVAPTAPRNYAETYVAAINPDADVLSRAGQTVLARQGTQLFVCTADDHHHTKCALVADWTEKPAQTTAQTPATEAPKTAPQPNAKATPKK